MKNALAALIDLKTILTLSLTFTFIYLSVILIIPVESYMVIFGMVIGWYFTKDKFPASSTNTTETTTTSSTTTPATSSKTESSSQSSMDSTETTGEYHGHF